MTEGLIGVELTPDGLQSQPVKLTHSWEEQSYRVAGKDHYRGDMALTVYLDGWPSETYISIERPADDWVIVDCGEERGPYDLTTCSRVLDKWIYGLANQKLEELRRESATS